MNATEARKLSQAGQGILLQKEQVEYDKIIAEIKKAATVGKFELVWWDHVISERVYKKLQTEGYTLKQSSQRNETYTQIKW